MKAKSLWITLALGLACVAVAVTGQAQEIYQWTDENGVVHFSQWAPGEEVENVETVRVDTGQGSNGLGISEADDPEGYQAHREEMDALWAELEARRQAERQHRESAPVREVVYYPSDESYGYPYFYPGYGLRPPSRPDRPPLRPQPHPEPVPSFPYKRP